MERKETAKVTDTVVTSDIENGETESINDSRFGIHWWLGKIRLPDVPNDDSKWSNAGAHVYYKKPSDHVD